MLRLIFGEKASSCRSQSLRRQTRHGPCDHEDFQSESLSTLHPFSGLGCMHYPFRTKNTVGVSRLS